MDADAIDTPHKLDDVMLAMDVVDTLRHDAKMLDYELGADDREEKLLIRLREIYAAQGIDVPDAILRDGVKAMDDHRFAYTPQKNSFLARAYINRGKWGKPLLALLGVIGFAWAVNYAAFEAPKKSAAKKQTHALSVSLPQALGEARDDAIDAAQTSALKARAQAFYDNGMAAAKDGDLAEAERITAALENFAADLRQSYTVRIVSRPGENSGVFRLNDDAPGAKNYYLIVEGLDASGKPVSVSITSEEDQKSARTSIWGVRVSKAVFDKVAADKRDDQIIQNAVIGAKKRGLIDPEYTIETAGGLILEW